RRLFRGTNESIDANVARLRGARGGQFIYVHLVARGSKIGIVVRCQHRDRENAERGSALAFDRGLHGLRISMHGDEGRAELSDALNTLGDRIADVVQLEVEKSLLARRNQFRRKRQAAGESEL